MRRSQTSTVSRRSFLETAGRFGRTVATASLLSPGPLLLGPARRAPAKTPTPEPLVQPTDIRSASGILDATITAAPGRVRLGDHEFAGLLYNGAYMPPTFGRASAIRCASPSATTCRISRRTCTITA